MVFFGMKIVYVLTQVIIYIRERVTKLSSLTFKLILLIKIRLINKILINRKHYCRFAIIYSSCNLRNFFLFCDNLLIDPSHKNSLSKNHIILEKRFNFTETSNKARYCFNTSCIISSISLFSSYKNILILFYILLSLFYELKHVHGYVFFR